MAKAELKQSVLLIVGVSGAGKTTVLHALEDCGFKTVDGLPVDMILPMVMGKDKDKEAHIAIGVDTLAKDFAAKKLALVLETLNKEANINAKILYLECTDREILRRYKETRRVHPFAKGTELAAGIVKEREKLVGLDEAATNIIDTTELTAAELKNMTEKIFCFVAAREMVISVVSFSYRVGLPQDADLIFDVRFLRNPHYDDDLRHLTGLDDKVGEYIRQDKDFLPFMETLKNLLQILIPRYELEGKNYLTIAVGCTGGRHRSVFVAEELAKWLAGQGKETISHHREIVKK